VAFAKLYDRKTPMQSFLDTIPLARAKTINAA